MMHALENTDKGFVVNPALMQVSRGDLLLPEGIHVSRDSDNNAVFQWDNQPLPWAIIGSTGADERDQVMVLAYDIEVGERAWILVGAFRKEGKESLQLTSDRPHHCWLAFIAADRSRQSESVYLGIV
jgi:hypothetical protein